PARQFYAGRLPAPGCHAKSTGPSSPHVTNYRGHMRNYRERLQVPWSWWVLGMLTAVILATTLWAGFSIFVAIASYVVFGGGCAAALLVWSSTAIEVADGELRAGSATMPLRQAGEVAALDATQARAMRGPRGDPAAFMLIRPYLTRAVYVEVSGQQAPYWLIGTRRPAELVAAIERSRPPARAGGAAVGGCGLRRAQGHHLRLAANYGQRATHEPGGPAGLSARVGRLGAADRCRCKHCLDARDPGYEPAAAGRGGLVTRVAALAVPPLTRCPIPRGLTRRVASWRAEKVSRIGVANPTSNPEALVDADLDTLATALYVRTDDMLKESPQLGPWRPEVGTGGLKLSDAELVTLAVLQALPGFTSEARWLRHARSHLRHLFPSLPQQPGYNKRLRAAAPMIRHCIRALAADTTVWTDDVWVVDSTPVECGRSRETARHSDLAGWAEYGYCASHSRYFRGLRLHLVCTLQGLPVAFALAGAK